MLAFGLSAGDSAAIPLNDGHVTVGAANPSLSAVLRLARAVDAALLRFDRSDGSLTRIESAAAEMSTAVPPAVIAAVRASPALLYAAAQPLWVVLPEGAGAIMIAKLSERGSITLLLALAFPDATAVSRARIAKLVPDLATLLGCNLDLAGRNAELAEQHAAVAAALDTDDVGVIAVRADHTIVFANAAASAMLADGAGLQIRRGALRPAHHGDAAVFQAALDAVVAPPRGERPDRRRAFVMLLTSHEGRGPVVAAVAPAMMHPESEATAIVRLLPSSVHAAATVDVLCRLHGLSRVETRLVAHLCAGTTVSEAAAEMRVKVETTRAYLKQVFAKTGTHRQADLVLLINRYTRAVQGRFDFQPA